MFRGKQIHVFEPTQTLLILALQCSVDDAYGHCHEGPALRTYVCRTGAESSLLTVSDVTHPNIKAPSAYLQHLLTSS